MKAFAAALLFALGTPGLAVAQTRPETRAPQAGDAARLAGLIIPEAQMPALIGIGFRQGFGASLAGNPEVKKTYDANPGMQDFVAERVSQYLARLAIADLPSLREQLAAVVRDELEAEEIVDTITFFESPTGMKMRARATAALQEKGATSAEEGQKTAVAAAVADLTEDDYPALTAFGASSAAKKMQLVNTRIMEVTKAWGRQLATGNAASLETERVAAEKAFLAKGKAK
ncbi:DUF2059 domain-containing protein [Sphingomonas elodea]|uniref:DUF2059 domain-containing protein n=1 Tax=Sphingomonas elodea TaxID=179878 RepID=UPI0002630CF2|nr:DUF2059 domain-containing protein [Sphingomonas elodea]